jgi:hypothetical protein
MINKVLYSKKKGKAEVAAKFGGGLALAATRTAVHPIPGSPRGGGAIRPCSPCVWLCHHLRRGQLPFGPSHRHLSHSTLVVLLRVAPACVNTLAAWIWNMWDPFASPLSHPKRTSYWIELNWTVWINRR